jgi:hypothetical protein
MCAWSSPSRGRAGASDESDGTEADGWWVTDPETAADTLARSPRHGEWMNVKSGVEIVRTYIVHPVRKDRGPCVIVVAEGLTTGRADWRPAR